MTLNVLIVDDDPIFGEPLRQRLERSKKFEARARFASKVEEAIQIANLLKEGGGQLDIFLLDQRLEAETNGIELANTLLNYHPDAEFIVFTGFETGNNGGMKDAIRAGAFQHLRKPFRFGELENLLITLIEKRNVNKEKDWMQVILELGNAAGDVDSVQSLGIQAMSIGLKLGFKRGRLWQRISKDEFVCTGQVGHGEEDSPVNFKQLMPLSTTGRPADKKRGTFYFSNQARRDVNGDLERIYQPPVGEWVLISLGTPERCEALIAFDHDQEEISLSKNKKDYVDVFGRQVNAALTKLTERKRAQQLEIINVLSSDINTYTASGNLNDVLQAVFKAIEKSIYAPSIKVAIKNSYDEDSRTQYHFESDKRTFSKNITQSAGMISHIIETRQSIFEPLGTEEYRKQNDIKLVGEPAKSWVGVPLESQNEVVGALILEDDDVEGRFSEEDRNFLESIADLVAGAIYTVRLKKENDWHQEQLRLLHYASEQIIRYADDPELLWSFVLTVVHVVCGRSPVDWIMALKRDVLSLKFGGYTGIRTNEIDAELLADYWRVSDGEKVGFNLHLFSAHLESGKIVFPKKFKKHVSHNAKLSGKAIPEFKQFVQSKEKSTRFIDFNDAKEITGNVLDSFEAEKYMLFSIKPSSERRTMGVLIFAGKYAIEDTIPINHLEPFLRQVALAEKEVEEKLVLRAQLKFEQLTSSENAESKLSLKEQLSQLAKVALDVVPAGRVIIHPLVNDRKSFDTEQFGFAVRSSTHKDPQTPRPGGLSEFVLNSSEGVLSIKNLKEFDQSALQLEHEIRSTNRNALIGLRIESPVSKEKLGIFYADYDYEVEFSEQLVNRFKLFVLIAGRTIHNYETRRDRNAKLESTAAIHERLLEGTKLAQTAGLNFNHLQAEGQEQKLIRELIKGMKQLLADIDTVVCLMLKERRIDPETGEIFFVKQHYGLGKNGKLKSIQVNFEDGLSGKVFATGEPSYIPDVRKSANYSECGQVNPQQTISEFDIPIKIDGDVIGVWNLESIIQDAYSDALRVAIENYARTTGQVIQNLRNAKQISGALNAVQSVTEDIPPEQSIQAIGHEVFKALDDAETLTIWYKSDLESTQEVELGYFVGVNHPEKMSRSSTGADTAQAIVLHTMQLPETRYTENINIDTQQKNGGKVSTFVSREKLKSTVEIPLRSGDDVVGAMFIGYRNPKQFSKDLKNMISLLAQITAANIRDSVNLANLREEKEHQQKLLALIEAVGDTLQIDEALRKILGELQAMYPAESIAILGYDSEKQVLEPFSISSEFYFHGNQVDEYFIFRTTFEEEGVVHIAAKQAKIEGKTTCINIQDISISPHKKQYADLFPDVNSALVLGLFGNNGLLGALLIDSPHVSRFTSEDEELLQGVAKLLVAVLGREEQRRRLNFNSLVASRTAWAAELAHESKNEIGRMLNRLNWLQEEVEFEPEPLSWVNEIEGSVNTLNTLMNDPSVEGVFDVENNYDIYTEIRGIVEQIVERQGHKDITQVEFEFSEEGVQTNIPKVSLRRVLTYILHNAIEAIDQKFDFPQGGQITIRNCSSTQEEEGKFTLCIQDNGIGIDPAKRSQILNLPVTSNKGKNRGHGLMFAKMLVQNLDGALWLDSSPDEDVTRFALRIPLERFTNEELNHEE